VLALTFAKKFDDRCKPKVKITEEERKILADLPGGAPKIQDTCPLGIGKCTFVPNGKVQTKPQNISAGAKETVLINAWGANKAVFVEGSYDCDLYISIFGFWVHVKTIPTTNACEFGFNCPIPIGTDIDVGVTMETDGSQISGNYKGECLFHEIAIPNYAGVTILFNVV